MCIYRLPFIKVVLISTSPSSVGECLFPHTLINTVFSKSLISANVLGAKWYFEMVVKCIFLIVSDIEPLFICPKMHLGFLCCEELLQMICLFSDWVIGLFLVEFKRFFIYLGKLAWHLLQIFFPSSSVICLWFFFSYRTLWLLCFMCVIHIKIFCTLRLLNNCPRVSDITCNVLFFFLHLNFCTTWIFSWHKVWHIGSNIIFRWPSNFPKAFNWIIYLFFIDLRHYSLSYIELTTYYISICP